MAHRWLGLSTFAPHYKDDPLRPAIGFGQGWLAVGVAALAALHLHFAPAWKDISDNHLTYAPTARHGSANPVALLIDADTLVPLAVHFDADTVSAYDITTVRPGPATFRLEDGGLTLIFDAQRSGPLDLHMDLRPRSLGWIGGQVRVDGDAIYTLTQLVHP